MNAPSSSDGIGCPRASLAPDAGGVAGGPAAASDVLGAAEAGAAGGAEEGGAATGEGLAGAVPLTAGAGPEAEGSFCAPAMDPAEAAMARPRTTAVQMFRFTTTPVAPCREETPPRF